MENVIEMKIIPQREFGYYEDSSYGIYSCTPEKPELVEVNRQFNSISVKGNTVRLNIGQEYNAKLLEKENQNKNYGKYYYEIVSIFEDIPTDVNKQRSYLMTILTENQVNEIYNTYPNADVIQMIKDDKFDYEKVKGVGLKTFLKIKDKIIENLEFQKAYDFLSTYGVTNNMIVKLVKHFQSASLLIEKMKINPYSITVVSGVGFKKADAIAMAMGHDPKGEKRIKAAIEHIVLEESLSGSTYVTTDNLTCKVEELIDVGQDSINKLIEDSHSLIVIGDKVALKYNYEAEVSIAETLGNIISKSTELNFNPEEFIKEQEELLEIKLTHQQKEFFYNVRKHNANLLIGYAGCGKSKMTELLINLLEKLGISYKLVSPTGKAAKILSGYTNREAVTISKAIGQGSHEDEGEIEIKEEFLIIDEMSMVDARLCSQLLRSATNKNLRILMVGDDFQLPSVSAGKVLYDLITSAKVPTTMLDIVFRQSEGGMLDVATKIRKGEKILNNNDWGIFKFGDDCIIASVPQDKMQGGYLYYLKEYLKEFGIEDITITSPTKKGSLGIVEINKEVQTIVNPANEKKIEKEYGYDKVIFREGDYVLNTVNTYKIPDVNNRFVNIVNGDIGKIIKIDLEESEILVDFEFAIVPFPFSKLNQLLHCAAMTIHKMQGSANDVVIVVLDKAHKFQINANLLYTAGTRARKKLIIITQAETLNYALRKKANLQRNTFLEDVVKEQFVSNCN